MRLNLFKATTLAIEAATQSTERHHMGATLYTKTQHITSFNRTFSVIVRNRKTQYSSHAEESCITHALHLGFNLTQSTLVVVRINNKGSLLLARPCNHCTTLIQKMNIPRVYYSNDPLHREFTPENFKSLKIND